MEFFHHLLHIVSRRISRCFSPCFVKSALSLPSLPPKSAKRQILPTRALLRPPTFFFKKRSSDLTSWNWHDILIAVDGALAQLVAHNTGSVGVRSSNLLCSTKPKKSEHHPDWGWVRISSFYLKYCGVIESNDERRAVETNSQRLQQSHYDRHHKTITMLYSPLLFIALVPSWTGKLSSIDSTAHICIHLSADTQSPLHLQS